MGTLGAKVCSKAARSGQWAVALAAVATLCASGCSRHSRAPTPPPGQTGGRQTPSGFPVPRYVSTKFDKVNARVGPGDDYAVKWVYRVKGLPLQVVAETAEWRRVCDSDGSLSWVRSRTTDARRTVMRTQPQDLVLRAKPDDASAEVATLVGHAIAELKECQGDWCRLSVGHAKGWTRSDQVWGTASPPQCH